MTIYPFDYLQPDNLSDAVSALKQYGSDAALLAGGTDLLILLKTKSIAPKVVINLKHIPGLDGINNENGETRIGALTKIHAIEKSDFVQQRFPALRDAACVLGSVQIRHLATVGGNLCRAAPCSETTPPLMAFGATIRLVGPDGDRTLPLEAFFSGPGQTVRLPEEILTDIHIKTPSPRTGAAYVRHSIRPLMDLAIVNIAVSLTLAEDKKTISESRIVLGSVAPTVIRAPQTENLLKGEEASNKTFDAAAEMAANESQPITDVRGTDIYRREMVRLFTRRALDTAYSRASGKSN